MTLDTNLVDALIFDMDGTLWDATCSYAALWNQALSHMGESRQVTVDELKRNMGKPLDAIYADLLGDLAIDMDAFLAHLREIEEAQMPTLGGVLYPDVKETLTALSHSHKLLLMSNCGPRGLKNFMAYTGLASCFTGDITYGERPVPKSENLRYLQEVHNLRHPVYVGDVQADCDQSHMAGMPFVWASYGFGQVADADLKITSFGQLATIFKQ